jgi:ferredoxin
MADRTQRWEDNAPGPWYVDKSCILCSLCSDLAPRTFRESESGDHDVVFRQPRTAEEIEAAGQARLQCPVDAIADDG